MREVFCRWILLEWEWSPLFPLELSSRCWQPETLAGSARTRGGSGSRIFPPRFAIHLHQTCVSKSGTSLAPSLAPSLVPGAHRHRHRSGIHKALDEAEEAVRLEDQTSATPPPPSSPPRWRHEDTRSVREARRPGWLSTRAPERASSGNFSARTSVRRPNTARPGTAHSGWVGGEDGVRPPAHHRVIPQPRSTGVMLQQAWAPPSCCLAPARPSAGSPARVVLVWAGQSRFARRFRRVPRAAGSRASFPTAARSARAVAPRSMSRSGLRARCRRKRRSS